MRSHIARAITGGLCILGALPGVVAAQLLDEAIHLRHSSAPLLWSRSLATSRAGWLGFDSRLVFNSALPFGLNDGALWAGRGFNLQLTTGYSWHRGRVRVTVAPELTVSQNRGFVMPDTLAPPIPSDRSPWSNPWYPFNESADIPIRFGPTSFAELTPGQSAVAINLGPLLFTISSESHWWGPGRWNALVLSSNAPGFPHIAVRSARPLATRAGMIEWIWLSGVLTESPWFDTLPTNDHRTLAGLALTWSPWFERGLTVGFARSVFSPASRWSEGATAWFDVFRDVGRPNRYPWYDYDHVFTAPDQLASVFARWAFPSAGAVVWGEWARTQQPKGLRDLLVDPDLGAGYTIGASWSRSVSQHRQIRVTAEATNLEKGTAVRGFSGSFYLSRAVRQGYTQRGQVLGAAIGPGASSQWLRLDVLGGRWALAGYAGRIRWNDDALMQYNSPLRLNRWCSHDVSALLGLSGERAANRGAVGFDVSVARRFNVHTQNTSKCPRSVFDGVHTDRTNLTVGLRWRWR